MPHQTNPNRYKVNLLIDLYEAAQLRTYIKGKTAPAYTVSNRRVVKKERPMTLGDLFESFGKKVAQGIVPDAESIQWMEAQRKRLADIRRRQDERTSKGEYRKPKKDYLKTGPKAGNPSPKFLAAMAKLGAKRRAMAKAGHPYRGKAKTSVGKAQKAHK